MSTNPISAVAPTQRAVKAARKGVRRPARSLMAPSAGDSRALSSTDALTATVNHSSPGPSPSARIDHRLMANETIAKLNIVFAKS